MPAITALATYAVSPLARVTATLGARTQRGFKELARRMRNRREAARLADLDAHMLRDIGLTPSDLRDAYSEPLWRDPTDVLARRAAERQGPAHPTVTDKLFAPQPEQSYPPLDRPCRHLV